MIRLVTAIFLSGFFLTSTTFANNLELEAQVLYDQHGEFINLTPETRWLVFSHDKDGGAWTKEALDKLEITNLEELGGIYLADISKMPSLITKMFAMPKMKKYAFKMAIDKDGSISENLPRLDGRVTLIKLDNLKAVRIKQVGSPEEIEAFILLQIL